MRRSFTGIVERRPWSGDIEPVFLGTEIPLVAELAHNAPAPAHFTCRVEARIEGCTPKVASGTFELRFLVRNPDGPPNLYRVHVIDEVFSVAGKDVAELLRKAVGRRARLTVEFREKTERAAART